MNRRLTQKRIFLTKEERIDFYDKQPRINQIVLCEVAANKKELEDLIAKLETLTKKVPISSRGNLTLLEAEIISKAEGSIDYLKEIYRAITGRDYKN